MPTDNADTTTRTSTTPRKRATAGPGKPPLAIRWSFPLRHRGLLTPLKPDWIISRKSTGVERQTVLDSLEVSKSHAKISVRGGAFYLRDNDSKNGCFVNGRAIDGESRLNDQDVVRLGECVGVVCEDYAESAENPVQIWQVVENRDIPLKVSCEPFDAAAARVTTAERLEGRCLIGGGLVASTLKLTQTVAESDSSVVIIGETGTGKEGVARAIHGWSQRRGKPFIAVNCGELQKDLAEKLLFGDLRGSFTGALGTEGLFQSANTGTLFLDEIAELQLDVQVKLLRALQERVVRKVGANNDTRVDVRIIAATQEPLDVAVREGRFRGDLQGRLQMQQVTVPPLRDRREDIPYILDWLLHQYAHEPPGLEPEVVERLCLDDWPKNVRGLQAIARELITAASLCKTSTIDMETLVRGTRGRQKLITALTDLRGLDGPVEAIQAAPPRAAPPMRTKLDEFREKALQAYRELGDFTKAARECGLVDWYTNTQSVDLKKAEDAARRRVERWVRR